MKIEVSADILTKVLLAATHNSTENLGEIATKLWDIPELRRFVQVRAMEGPVEPLMWLGPLENNQD